MSIASAMSTAVSGLKSEAQALSTVANNLANSSTIGYKANNTRFISMVTTAYTDNTPASGSGVTAVTRQNVGAQGTISATSDSTDMAIDGNGFFVVTRKTNGADTTANYLYTRDGEFSIDSEGYLSLGDDFYLEGYTYTWDSRAAVNNKVGAYTAKGTATGALHVDTSGTVYDPTDSVTLSANLPRGISTWVSKGNTSTSVNTTTTIYDTDGESHPLTLTFTPDSVITNQWSISLSSSDAALTFNVTSGASIMFDPSTGGITSSSLAEATVTKGAGTAQNLSFDFTDLTEYNTGTDISVNSLTQDGYGQGTYSGLTIDSAGKVVATYSTGQEVMVGYVALANCANPNGLTVMSDGMYQQSTKSGPVKVGRVGDYGTGTIRSEALEASTTDTGTEFTKMIVAQQAYSAASQVISTSKTMYDDLVSAVR